MRVGATRALMMQLRTQRYLPHTRPIADRRDATGAGNTHARSDCGDENNLCESFSPGLVSRALALTMMVISSSLDHELHCRILLARCSIARGTLWGVSEHAWFEREYSIAGY